jgi:hypothetical protein
MENIIEVLDFAIAILKRVAIILLIITATIAVIALLNDVKYLLESCGHAL